MMNVAQPERNVYEDFDLKSDILFFKLGSQGLVSFHGKNYNRKRRMNAEDISRLIRDNGYFRVSSNCYINIAKIKSIASGTISFGSDAESKQVNVNRRKQHVVQQLFKQWAASKELRITQ